MELLIHALLHNYYTVACPWMIYKYSASFIVYIYVCILCAHCVVYSYVNIIHSIIINKIDDLKGDEVNMAE